MAEIAKTTLTDKKEQVEQTRAYVKKHRLNELFAQLLQLLIYYKPEDPRAFLRNEIQLMVEQKKSTPLFTEEDLETMFDLIDVTKQRWITINQLRNTCKNLATAAGEGKVGISSTQEAAIANAADANGHISVEKFKEILAMQLLATDLWSSETETVKE